jgi:hypothetical protein
MLSEKTNSKGHILHSFTHVTIWWQNYRYSELIRGYWHWGTEWVKGEEGTCAYKWVTSWRAGTALHFDSVVVIQSTHVKDFHKCIHTYRSVCVWKWRNLNTLCGCASVGVLVLPVYQDYVECYQWAEWLPRISLLFLQLPMKLCSFQNEKLKKTSKL